MSGQNGAQLGLVVVPLIVTATAENAPVDGSIGPARLEGLDVVDGERVDVALGAAALATPDALTVLASTVGAFVDLLGLLPGLGHQNGTSSGPMSS